MDIVERRFKWPINGWPSDPKLKRIGELNLIRVIENVEAFAMRLLTGTANVRLLLMARGVWCKN